jgi:hypothetical protein
MRRCIHRPSRITWRFRQARAGARHARSAPRLRVRSRRCPSGEFLRLWQPAAALAHAHQSRGRVHAAEQRSTHCSSVGKGRCSTSGRSQEPGSRLIYGYKGPEKERICLCVLPDKARLDRRNEREASEDVDVTGVWLPIEVFAHRAKAQLSRFLPAWDDAPALRRTCCTSIGSVAPSAAARASDFA